MVGVTKAISDALFEKVKTALQEVSRSGDISRKLQAIKSAKTHGVTAIANIFGVSRMAIMDWIEAFETEGIEGLKLKPGRGRNRIMTEDEVWAIHEWIKQDSQITIKAVKLKIADEFGKSLSMAATHNLMRSLNFTYITPRPKHYKQDKTAHEAFKKKSSKRSTK